MNRRAVFLDRDGVIVRDHPVVAARQLEVLPGVAGAIRAVREVGYLVFVATNQPIVARGLATEADVRETHLQLQATLEAAGAQVDGFYVCPHHPNATIAQYRVECECRKPRPGLLLAAASDHSLDLSASVMVGDRLTDVAAGRRAGCRTVLVRTGMHEAPAIESPDAHVDVAPDANVADLAEAIAYVLRVSS